MRFIVSISGDHNEGHDCGTRFQKIVATFVDQLRTNGFVAEKHFATHDLDSNTPAPAPAPIVIIQKDMGVVGVMEPGPTVETAGTQAAVVTVDFASDAATELADAYDLTDTDFVGVSPSGAYGFTTEDVRKIIKAKSE